MRNKKDKTCYTNTTDSLRKRPGRFLSLTGFTPLEMQSKSNDSLRKRPRRFLSLTGLIFCLIFLSIGYAQEDNIDEMVNQGLSSLEARISFLIEENISLKQTLKDLQRPERAEDNSSLGSRDEGGEPFSQENYSLSKLLEEKSKEIDQLKIQLADLRKEAQARQEAEYEQ